MDDPNVLEFREVATSTDKDLDYLQ